MQVDQAQQSPNRSSRHGQPIVLLVIHATVGPLGPSIAWLCRPASATHKPVSSHYVISKRGDIYQLVPDTFAAWHAGDSAWRGLDSDAIQEQSLGIELENANDGRDPYPKAQMEALYWLCREKIAQYHIAPEMVVRHLEIATPPGRKTDPAGFPWEMFKAQLFAGVYDTPRPPPPPTAQTDPLRAHVIAGATRSYFAGSGFLDFYSTQGGLSLFGYPLTDEARDTDSLGQSCTWMRMERCVFKYKDGEGVHLALLSEAVAKGWIV